MKIKFLSIVALAATLASCSQSEVIDSANESMNPNRMTFLMTTTRAAENTVDSVAKGFQVYGVADGGSVWYTDGASNTADVDGTYDYFKPTTGSSADHLNTGWAWRDGTSGDATIQAPLWPESGYPMTFYAKYPVTTRLSAANPAAAMTSAIKINTNRFAQVDELAAVATADAMPTDGRLSLTFEHILSKVNVAVTANTGYVVEVQSANFVNINSAGTYNYKNAETADNTAWSSIGTEDDYEYRRTVFATSQTASDVAWENPVNFLSTITGTGSAISIKHNNNTNSSAASFVPGDLMLVPQTFTATTIVSGDYATTKANIEKGAYLEVIYRMEGPTPTSSNILGFEDINTGTYRTEADGTVYTWAEILTSNWGGAGSSKVYPYYTNNNTADVRNDYVTNGVVANTDALYIKAYFPLYTGTSGIATWNRGSSYLYNIQMGSAGAGFYADNQYYDEAGNPTGLYHGGKPGQPVTEKRMHFNVIANSWAADQTVGL